MVKTKRFFVDTTPGSSGIVGLPAGKRLSSEKGKKIKAFARSKGFKLVRASSKAQAIKSRTKLQKARGIKNVRSTLRKAKKLGRPIQLSPKTKKILTADTARRRAAARRIRRR